MTNRPNTITLCVRPENLGNQFELASGAKPAIINCLDSSALLYEMLNVEKVKNAKPKTAAVYSY